MAVDEVLVLKGEGNVDVQVGGPGQSAWAYLSACASMDGPSVPQGDTELRYCQDAQRAGKFTVSSKIQTAPDQITGNLLTKLGKIDHLNGLDCPFALRARYNKCGAREDPTVFDPLMIIFNDVTLTSIDYDELVITDPGSEDEILVTAAYSATDHYRVQTVVGARAGSAAEIGDAAINDWAICDDPQCAGYCGTRLDGCSLYYGVTDLDTTPYPWPNLITGIKNILTDVVAWYTHPILGVPGNVENVECAGTRVIVASNGATMVAYNDTYDEYGVPDQDEWNPVALTHAPAANGNALYARTSREIWLACADGYVGKSIDAGETWTYTDVGTALNAIFAYDADLVYVVGQAGEMYRSSDGGSTWADITEVATTAANLLVVVVPPSRIQEVYIGTDDGQIFRSQNQGDTFAAMGFTGDGVGTVDDLAFWGAVGDVLWILHNNAGPQGRVLRDLSGGYGGPDVRVEIGYTSVVAAGVELNAIAACDANTAWAAGEVTGGYPAVFKIA